MASTTPSPLSSAAVFGSTGLVGSHILATLLQRSASQTVHIIGRRAPKTTSTATTVNSVVETDTEKWGQALTSLWPKADTVYSSVGTTRAIAGSIAAQWKIDHDLNIAIAKAAKESGVSTFLFVSSAATRAIPSKFLPYSRMKNGVEDAIRELDFDHAIILKPGWLLGEREQSRGLESRLQGVLRGIGKVSSGFQDAIGQDSELIGLAALRAAELAKQGKAPSKYWVIEANEILKLGRAAKAEATTTTTTTTTDATTTAPAVATTTPAPAAETKA